MSLQDLEETLYSSDERIINKLKGMSDEELLAYREKIEERLSRCSSESTGSIEAFSDLLNVVETYMEWNSMMKGDGGGYSL